MASQPSGGVGRQLLWFIGLWAASVLALGIAAYAIRLVLMY